MAFLLLHNYTDFIRETVEILPPGDFIAKYLNEKAAVSAHIENILGRITAAMNQRGVQ